MKREYHRWHSPRLGIELGVVVYGHWGPPLLGFPTSAGDEWELEGQGMIGALADFIDAGKVKFFSVNSINGLSFYDKSAHPCHRSYVQSVFDSYLREEVVPFIWSNCQSQIAISTMGMSFAVDYLANLSDPWAFEQLASCDIHIATGTGQWENSGPSYRLSEILAGKGIRHSLDNWGPEGGHDWPYWKHMMREYIARLF